MELIYESDGGSRVALNGIGPETESPFALTAVQGLYGLGASVRLTEAGPETVWASTRVLPRNIRIEGIILNNVAENRRALLACVSPLSAGWLILNRVNSKRRIRCHIKEAPAFDQTDGARFSMEMVSPSPYWEEALGDRTVSVSGWKGGIEFPLEITEKFEFGWRALGVSVSVHNPGDVRTGLTLKIVAFGPVINPQLLLTDEGEVMRMVTTLLAGDELNISTGTNEKQVTIRRANGAVENGITALDPESAFIALCPGKNILRASADSGENAMEATVSFRAKYIAI